MWYRRAAEQGDTRAQYSLGLLYDRGFGVPQDIVEASKWLNLSTAAAPPPVREPGARIRDAVTTKMTRGERWPRPACGRWNGRRAAITNGLSAPAFPGRSGSEKKRENNPMQSRSRSPARRLPPAPE
ncbi:tetratricopeptide repeat protein [Bradyrhizobium canariense]|uniref:tetratricopeptide repeat protein n=1 Tax=Bradyrhizobium canariense TaxID=255045 RepID=UPI001FE31F3F|nr:hypothetical protein [Bradyrhizobium canariense]